jgi:DNA-binding response OmpR family regulator
MNTVLIVDDEVGLNDVLAAALTDAGFRTMSAANGEDAFIQLADATPDLMLLDYMMPRLDGAAVLKRARADERWARLPIILMSAVDPRSIDCDAYSAFLRKPFTLRRLLDTIGRVLPS